MRISSLQIFNIANNGMADANKALVKTQEQLSTGVRVLTPSDDPVAATKILQLNQELASTDQFNRNIDIAENNLVQEESALRSVTNLMLRMKELTVQAGNTAVLTQTEYAALASEVDSRVGELQNLLNTQNPGGDYIFGGYQSNTPPFTGDAISGFTYNGDEGQQKIKVSPSTNISTSDSGKAIFVDIPSVENTAKARTSPNNQSVPPINVSVAQITDQKAFDEFYPEDMIVTFNADNFISPPAPNFTVTERSTGKIVAQNQPFGNGSDIEFNGVKFKISGAPASGQPATPATQNYNQTGLQTLPQDFSLTPETFSISIAGRTETLTLNGPINNTADLQTMLNDPFNGNAEALTRLGMTADSNGLRSDKGINFTINSNSALIDDTLGIDTTTGSTSTNGELSTPGDRIFIEASEKQDVLSTLVQLSEAMKTFDGTPESRDQLEQVVATTLGNLTNIETSVLNTTSELGARFNTLESTKALNQDTTLVMTEALSQLRDIDYAEAATRLSTQSLILQAAQSSFLRVSQLNLFSQL